MSLNQAPMKGNSYKRFEAYKTNVDKTTKNIFDFFFNWLIKGTLVATLLSVNFVLFASSANYSLFSEGFSVFPHICLPITIIFIVSIGLMFLISFSAMLENVLVAFIATIVAYATINQFMTVAPESFLYSVLYNNLSPSIAMMFINNSDIFVSVGVGIIVLILLMSLNKKWIFYIWILLSMVFAGVIVDEYVNQRNKKEFMTLYETKQEEATHKGNKFVYIMLPNATSYEYLNTMQKDNMASKEIEKLKNLMLGFYSSNDFLLYNHAYVEEEDMFMNIVKQFNILSQKEPKDSLLDNVLIDGYMKFKNRNEKHIYLEENNLFENFKTAKYKINVYQSHGIELCHSNNAIIADKCVEKQNRPFNFQSLKVSEAEKTSLLVLQWIDSTKLFDNLSFFYKFFNIFTDANKLPLVGISYKNLEVINSIKTLDVIMDDMVKDSGDATYFTLLDMPGEMYVYDEFCNIKPKSQWVHKNNLPWVKIANTYNKKKAYIDQMSCVYGKLQEFINRIDDLGLKENTVVVVQGISGADYTEDKGFVVDFQAKKSISMAIKEPRNNSFKVNYEVCPASTFLIEYLYSQKACNSLAGINISDKNKKDILQNIQDNKFTIKDIALSQLAYKKWYGDWISHNLLDIGEVQKHIEAKKEKDKAAADEILRIKEEERLALSLDNDFELSSIEEVSEETQSVIAETIVFDNQKDDEYKEDLNFVGVQDGSENYIVSQENTHIDENQIDEFVISVDNIEELKGLDLKKSYDIQDDIDINLDDNQTLNDVFISNDNIYNSYTQTEDEAQESSFDDTKIDNVEYVVEDDGSEILSLDLDLSDITNDLVAE